MEAQTTQAQLAGDVRAANDHYLRLVELYLTPGMDENARWWLDRELDELEQDMRASGLL
ncbi:hypothetical protein [Brevibacillus sp. HD3.3A]|uniref:hypothetical protein n=1 Tax=Brevibacillus sp. HD3.3A TaxID=2738979 RepID=UPI00156B7308|nr:hypothetical protein [Brevibacillus sp. HD3.3A]UED70731.1 hypothetical protein HP435_08870 [Brevibacillus sp. HD3.3A]